MSFQRQKHRLSIAALIVLVALLFTFSGTEGGIVQANGPLPGQIIVDPDNPQWLVYNKDSNGDGKLDPFFLAGPGDPEGFLYRGSRNADGTRSGDQLALISKLAGTGANSIYMQGIRSHGGDGNSTENPFNNPNDSNSGIDSDILDQWENWFTEMDNNGIVIYFFFYDDAINVSSNLGWPLDGSGNLHPSEQNYINTIVNRFEHHKNLIWVVMEEVQEMGSDYVAHAKKIAQTIKQADDHDHVVAVHQLPGLSFNDFADDPNIDQFAIQDLEDNASSLHADMVTAWNNANGRYNLNMAEAFTNTTDYFGTGSSARKKLWAIAMGGGYGMAIGWEIDDTPVSTLQDAGRLVAFMESTSFNEMAPHDELAFGGTQYVLADPGNSYIAYASSLSGSIGLRNMTAGTYNFMWYDATNGVTVNQQNVPVSAGNQTWSKPAGIGNELAVFASSTQNQPAPSEIWPGSVFWPTATPESQGMSSAILADAPNNATNSIGTAIVIRNGYDVWHYGDPYATDQGWWASTMRSYLTTLFSMLIHDGTIPGGQSAVDMKVNDLPSQTAQGFGDGVLLKHLLNYTSCSNPSGTAWFYGCNFPTMENIFHDLTGGSWPWEYINAELQPVLEGKSWQAIEVTHDSDRLRVIGPEADMARWGYLWLRNGEWNGQQLLDPWFVEKATQPVLKPNGSGFAHVNEGYQIHLNTDGAKWPGLPTDTFAAIGGFGESIIAVIPSLDMVIARIGVKTSPDDALHNFIKPIVDAVTDEVTQDTTPPSKPAIQSAQGISESQIELSWSAATDSESGVAHYQIYRDGSEINTSTSTTFVDSGLSEGASHSYQISAVNGAGIEGAKSSAASATTLADTVRPRLSTVSANSPTSLVITFTENVETASATNKNNYSISNGISISSASMGINQRTVILTTSEHSENEFYQLTVNNVRDMASTPNTIAGNTQYTYSYVPGPVQVSGLSATSGNAYQAVAGGLTGGAVVFTDRAFTFTSVPTSLEDATYIKAANDDKLRTDSVLLTFDINQNADVYVGYDIRAISLPNWLNGWQDTAESIVTTDATYRLYKKAFPQGQVSLGATTAAGASFSGTSFSSYVTALVASGTGSGTSQNQVPSASFTTSPNGGLAPLPVIFNASGSTDDGQIVSYSWNFGDGSTGSGIQANHTYNTVGTFTVTLTVTDNGGLSHSATKTVVVNEPSQSFPPTFPGMSAPASDPDGDGLYEDTNGNGRFDFADIVTLFEHILEPIVLDNWQFFDFNGNGRSDMDDIKAIFIMISAGISNS